jgi:hypothetical protein
VSKSFKIAGVFGWLAVGLMVTAAGMEPNSVRRATEWTEAGLYVVALGAFIYSQRGKS